MFESMVSESDRSLRAAFNRWQWISNILALDSPADIRRYKLPKAFFDESQVRELMSLRIEFSKDAVARVKLEII